MTLTELNYYAKKFTPIVIIFVLVVFMLFLAVQLLLLYLGSQQNQQAQQPIPVEIVTTFNNIKPPIIPEAKASNTYTYILDTLDATPNVENATTAATIYFIPKAAASFGSVSTVNLMARGAGFDIEVTKPVIRDNVATFDDGKKKMEIDMGNFNFSFDYVLTEEDNTFDGSRPPSDRELISLSTSFFNRMERYPQELSKGTQNIMYMNFNRDTNEIRPLQNAEGSNMAEVDFFRPDVNGYPVVTSTYYNSPHYTLIGFNPSGQRIIRAQMKFLERSTDQTGVYPVRAADVAWQDLQTGKGYVVSAGQESGQIAIKKIFLAYYDPAVYQEYFQPVYVFLGDNNFAAYVPAVSEEYLLQE